MELVLFRDTLEEDATPQYGILTEDDEPEIICLCCGSTVEFENYEILERVSWLDISELLKKELEK